jgi:hypothetical protein
MKPTPTQIEHALRILDSAVKYDPSTLEAARAICARATPGTVASQQDDVGGDELAFHSASGQKVTRRVATNLFNMVAPKDNWKNPIDATVLIYDESTLSNLVTAIQFFTGSVATVSKLGSCKYHILAAGYYATIGA